MEQQHQQEAIYAVRRGKDVSNCLFFSWQDAISQIESPSSEWKHFDRNNLVNAVAFIKQAQVPPVPEQQRHDHGSHSSDGDIDHQTAELALLSVPPPDDVAMPSLAVARHALNRHEAHAIQAFELDPLPGVDLPLLPPTDETDLAVMNLNDADADATMEMELQMEMQLNNTEKDHSFVHNNNLPPSGTADVIANANTNVNSNENNALSISRKRQREADRTAFRLSDKPPARPWQNMYDSLKEHKEQTGSLYIDPKDKELSTLRRWVSEQRHQFKQYRNHKKHFMTPSKIKALMRIGFDFMEKGKHSLRSRTRPMKDTPLEKKWEDMFNALMRFKEMNGTVDVKKGQDDKLLYNWVMGQRIEYKKLANGEICKLTAAKIQKLNDIGFNFVKRPRYLKWEDRIEQLMEFKAKHGHLKIPMNDTMLGEFASRQRAEYTKYLEGCTNIGMNEAREKQLTDLGFVFLVGKRVPLERRMAKRKSWDERFQELSAFKEENGHSLVPQHAENGLGEWVHQQRKNYKLLKVGKQSSLTTERTIRLSDVGFIFDAAGHRRMRKFEADSDEKEAHGFSSAIAEIEL